MIIRVQADGTVLLIHHTQTVKRLATALKGTVTTKRASHVEPVLPETPLNDQIQLPAWNVDLRPIQGPASLETAFPDREAALEAEVRWIETNVLKPTACS